MRRINKVSTILVEQREAENRDLIKSVTSNLR